MRLKCIKLAGFKSFVDPTTVYFPSNLGAVVGPNGCGKSNIIDAVRWVMGESSAKNLRGESMTDVIFNGSGGRKPVGQASIELVFDNSEGKLVGEYASYSEISVRRKVTRESVNQYYLNGTKCRRRDITDLFLGTGLGPRSYAIIEQGMISKLIEARPEELRVFIEEAAGISKYKERRRDTENRIRRTHENLERLTDLREELERQLNRLHRQAQAAEKYTALKAEERQKKSWLQALKFQSINEQFQQQTSKASQLEVQVEALVTGQVSVDSQLETLREDHADANETFNKVQTRYYALGADLARIEQTIQHSEQRTRQLQVDFDQVQRELKEAEDSQQHDAEQLAHWQAELLDIEPETEMLSLSEEDAAEKQQLADEALQAWQGRWDTFQQRSAEPKRTVEVQKSRIQHLEQVQSRLNQKIERLQQELSTLGSDEAELDVAALAEQCAEQEMENDRLQIEHDTLQEQVQQARQQVSPLRSALDEVSNRLQMQRGRMASLEALQQAAQGQSSEGSDAWLAEHQLKDVPRLAEQLRVANDWQMAAETVLSSGLQALPVQQFDQLAESFAQVSGVAWPLLDGAATLSSNDKNTAIDLPLLTDFIEEKNGATPWVAGVYAAAHLPEALMARARLMDHESIVTQDGLWVGKNWLRVPNDADPQAGLLARQQEIDTLSTAIMAAEEQHRDLQSQLEQAETLVKDGEQSREAMQKQLQEGLKQFNHLNTSMNAKKLQWEQASLRRQHANNDIREAGEQLAVEAEHLAEARAILEVAIEAMEADSETLITLQHERETVRRQADMARQHAQQQKERFHQLAMRKQQVESQLQALQASQARLQEQVQRLQERREQLSFAMSEHQDPSLELSAEKEALLEKQISLEDALNTARNRVDGLDNRQRELQQQRSRDDKDLHGLRSQLEQARLQAKELETRLQGLDEQLKAEQWVVEVILAELPEDINVPELQSTIEQISQKISRLGAINLAAIEEYKTEAERKDYLDAQNADLCEALQTLEDAIAKIDMETRNRFKETFDKVNGGLQELFPKVFGGGNAYLELTGEDMLDTGIAIMARPPGKRNSTIHLLSGGEKALTAIALVFSIFRLNPAPFCMLDEVDAPLDDANVGRYAKMVEEMSESVQFIYITHNKGAMEMAHQLLGVTMHEPGVSRLVSVDVEEAAELAAS